MSNNMRWVTLIAVASLTITQLMSQSAQSPVLAQDLLDPLYMSYANANCIQIRVADLSTIDVIAGGDRIYTPGRIDVDWSSGIALSCQSQMFWYPSNLPGFDPACVGVPIVYAHWSNNERTRFQSGYYYSKRYGIATGGDIAILPGGKEFLLPTVLYRVNGDNSSNTILPNNPPFHVRKFAMPKMPSRPTQLGESLGSFETQGVAAQIVLSKDGKIAHVITDAAMMYSFDTDTMKETATPVSLPPIVGLRAIRLLTSISYIWADITADERFLVTNQGRTGAITVVDLEARTARTLQLDGDPSLTGGVAVNRGWTNAGWLAVHHGDQFAIYSFDPLMNGPLPKLDQHAIAPPILDQPGSALSIAWGGKGDRVIVSTSGVGGFNVYSMDTERGLERVGSISGCGKLGVDLWTANGELLPSPTPTRSPTSTAIPTDAPLPSDTPPASPTPTTTSSPVPTSTTTPTPSATPTPPPSPIYLPVALRETCPPTHRRGDAILVLDASTSMLDRDASGSVKLDAAVAAARAFLGLLDLAAGDQAAVVSFNADARVLQPLTDDRAALDGAFGRVEAAQQTCIVCGVEAAAAELASARRRTANAPVVVLLTDGRANPRPAGEAVAAATTAKAAGVTFFTIGLGEDVDADALAAIAAPAGQFFRSADAAGLAGIYGRIAVALPCPAEGFWGRR